MFVLFILALFTIGFIQGLLLEAVGFLASIKLIVVAYHNSLFLKALKKIKRNI